MWNFCDKCWFVGKRIQMVSCSSKKIRGYLSWLFFGWRSFSTFLALSWQLPQKWPQWRCQRLTEVSRQKETEKRPKICFPWNNRETNRQNCMFDFNTKRTSLHISNFSRREINLVPRCLGAILKMARVSWCRICFFGTHFSFWRRFVNTSLDQLLEIYNICL